MPLFAATETIVKDMLESCMVATRAALEAEKSAAEAIAVHTGLIKRAMEDESQVPTCIRTRYEGVLCWSWWHMCIICLAQSKLFSSIVVSKMCMT